MHVGVNVCSCMCAYICELCMCCGGYVCVSVHECVRIGGQAAAGCLPQLLSLILYLTF